jgi:hypothetical protein
MFGERMLGLGGCAPDRSLDRSEASRRFDRLVWLFGFDAVSGKAAFQQHVIRLLRQLGPAVSPGH